MVIWTDGGKAARVAASVAAAGVAAGALGPYLAGLAPWAPAGALGAALALAGWLARGRLAPAFHRTALGAFAGVVAGLLAASAAPAGLAHAVLGLGVGLAFAPIGLRAGAGRTFLRALPAAAGALAGGVLAGVLAEAPALAALSPVAEAAVLHGAIGLGVGLAELTRFLVFAPEEPPAWIRLLEQEAGDRVRPVLTAATDAYGRIVRGARDADDLDADDHQETLDLSWRLLQATARAAREAERIGRAARSLDGDAKALAGHEELQEARDRLSGSLGDRREALLEEAGRHAASLSRLALSLTDRSIRSPGDLGDLAPADLERAVARLGRRVAAEGNA